MNRRILLHLSGPIVMIGLVLFGAAMGSVWSIRRLQANLTSIVTYNVTSLEAAQELELHIRQVRFRSLLHVMDPRPEHEAAIIAAERAFESALNRAKKHVTDSREADLLHQIETGYARYRKELLEGERPTSREVNDYVNWVAQHPIRHLQGPCNELLEVNKQAMEKTAYDSYALGGQTGLAVLALGILGPIGGLIIGAMVARAWSRSIAHLSVRLQDVQAQLSEDTGEMTVDFSQDWTGLDRQIDSVVERVKQAAAELQRQRRDILRAEQLAAVGQLAANVAHEIRNPLTSIKMLVGIALRPRSPQPLTEQDLRIIYEEVGKLEQTVQSLLDYAKPPRVVRKKTSLLQVVDQAVNLIRPKAEQNGVRVNVHAPDGPAPCRIDVGQLGSVVVNLLMNSVDALPMGGTIDVTVENLGGDVRFSVADDGPGLAPEVVESLFEPFTSTKPTGTGLGLSICQRIVREHHGNIVYDPRPSGGSRFVATLNAAGVTRSEVADAAIAGHR